jgi:hypothetical protein
MLQVNLFLGAGKVIRTRSSTVPLAAAFARPEPSPYLAARHRVVDAKEHLYLLERDPLRVHKVTDQLEFVRRLEGELVSLATALVMPSRTHGSRRTPPAAP